MSLNFRYSKNNDLLKEFNVKSSSLEDYSVYRKSLKSLQGIVNEYLTQLVNCEAGKHQASAEEPIYEDSSDSDQENEKNPKRGLSNERTSQESKIKKR